jgi:hypothetical protein
MAAALDGEFALRDSQGQDDEGHLYCGARRETAGGRGRRLLLRPVLRFLELVCCASWVGGPPWMGEFEKAAL